MVIEIFRFFVGLSALVLIHEFGHFLLAKKLGIKVEEFGFGFPPRVLGIKRGETIYSINILPIGGFVKLYGEDEAGSGKLKAESAKLKVEREKGDIKSAFFARPAWQRASIILAGVIMNFVLAVGIISYLFTSQGVPIPGAHIKIVDVLKNSPAESAGLKFQDEILSLNGKEIKETDAFIKETRNLSGQEIILKIKRGDKTSDVKIIPRREFPKGEGPMGVAISNIEIKKYKWYEAPLFGTYEALRFSYLMIKAMGEMIFKLAFYGTKPEGVAGPVGVYQLSAQAASYGLNAWLWFISLLSLNLAILNVLPIPALDGGRLAFIVVEMVTRRKVSQKYEALAHAIGLAVLLALMFLITLQDILRLASGKSILPTP